MVNTCWVLSQWSFFIRHQAGCHITGNVRLSIRHEAGYQFLVWSEKVFTIVLKYCFFSCWKLCGMFIIPSVALSSNAWHTETSDICYFKYQEWDVHLPYEEKLASSELVTRCARLFNGHKYLSNFCTWPLCNVTLLFFLTEVKSFLYLESGLSMWFVWLIECVRSNVWIPGARTLEDLQFLPLHSWNATLRPTCEAILACVGRWEAISWTEASQVISRTKYQICEYSHLDLPDCLIWSTHMGKLKQNQHRIVSIH